MVNVKKWAIRIWDVKGLHGTKMRRDKNWFQDKSTKIYDVDISQCNRLMEKNNSNFNNHFFFQNLQSILYSQIQLDTNGHHMKSYRRSYFPENCNLDFMPVSSMRQISNALLMVLKRRTQNYWIAKLLLQPLIDYYSNPSSIFHDSASFTCSKLMRRHSRLRK